MVEKKREFFKIISCILLFYNSIQGEKNFRSKFTRSFAKIFTGS